MPYAYTCADCGARFRASRKRCYTCGTTGEFTDRTVCIDCGSKLTDSAPEFQHCRACSSTNVERTTAYWR